MQTLLLSVYQDTLRRRMVIGNVPLATHIITTILAAPASVTHDTNGDYWVSFDTTVAEPGILDLAVAGVGRVSAAVEA